MQWKPKAKERKGARGTRGSKPLGPGIETERVSHDSTHDDVDHDHGVDHAFWGKRELNRTCADN